MLLDVLARVRARVVVVASDSHYGAKGIDFDALRRPTRSVTGLREYGVSKLCNVLFAQELSRRVGAGDAGATLPGATGAAVTTCALHPGMIASDIWRRLPWPLEPLATRFMKPTDEGARTSVHCATAPDVAAHSGCYYDECALRCPVSARHPRARRRIVGAQRGLDGGLTAAPDGFLSPRGLTYSQAQAPMAPTFGVPAPHRQTRARRRRTVMGLMDKVKSQATQLAEKAQQAGQAGQAKLAEVQSKRKADALLLELGGITYTQRMGRAAATAGAHPGDRDHRPPSQAFEDRGTGRCR